MMAAEKPIPDRIEPEGSRPHGSAERRQAPRVLLHLEVDYASTDNFLFAYIRDISATGIFVRTDTPEPAGTRLNLRFQLPDADGSERTKPMDLEGEVIWVNPYRPGRADSLNPGMGVRFVGLTEGESKLLRLLVKTFAFLDD